MSIPSAEKHTSKRHTKCLHCGNNPTSHISARVGATISMPLERFSHAFEEKRIGRFLFSIADYVLAGAYQLGVYLRIIRFTNDISCVCSDRGKVICEEAHARGWKGEIITVFGKMTDSYRITVPHHKAFIFTGIPKPSSQGTFASNWIDDKITLKKRLEEHDIAVSKGECFQRFEDALHFFHAMKKPIIVKPRVGSRGRHTTTHIYTEHEFKEAFRIAKQLCPFVIVEEHLVGSVYRATMIGGRLAGVLAGDPPRITGDGVHSIQELIEIKNANRHERVGEVYRTEKLIAFLARLQLTLDSVLENGTTIDLSEKIGLSYGGNSREVTQSVHTRLRDELERASRVVNDPVIGFDFISTDVSADPNTVPWGIIECNTVPFINLHHDPLEGEPVNVASVLLDFILNDTQRLHT